jgi:hypothetical protein
MPKYKMEGHVVKIQQNFVETIVLPKMNPNYIHRLCESELIITFLPVNLGKHLHYKNFSCIRNDLQCISVEGHKKAQKARDQDVCDLLYSPKFLKMDCLVVWMTSKKGHMLVWIMNGSTTCGANFLNKHGKLKYECPTNTWWNSPITLLLFVWGASEYLVSCISWRCEAKCKRVVHSNNMYCNNEEVEKRV